MRRMTGDEFLAGNLEELIPRTKTEIISIKSDVLEIIANVRGNGDLALLEYSEKFDGVKLSSDDIRVTPAVIEAAYKKTSPELVAAIRFALANIKTFHAAQLREEWSVETVPGVNVGQIIRPIDSVGVYIPGGRAIYPSTVLMTVGPASVAGVPRIVIATPPQADGLPAPEILVAAKEAGVSEIYNIGGVQAIAALALGTPSVTPVQKIIGPGNKFVNVAKQLLADEVAIDTPAGPSEVLIIADGCCNPELAAIDFISQVEHDPDNIGILVCISPNYLEETLTAINTLLTTMERKEIITAAMEKNGIAILARDLDQAVRISNLVAPEHLELLVKDPKGLLPSIRHAGAVFLGCFSPVPIGDYAAGSNHVLPTGGAAKFASGLNSLDFVKVIDVVEASTTGLKELQSAIETLAGFEGLQAHKATVTLRANRGSTTINEKNNN